MSDKRYTDAEKRQAVAMVKSGVSKREVCRQMGMSHSALRTWCREAGLPSQARGRQGQSPYVPPPLIIQSMCNRIRREPQHHGLLVQDYNYGEPCPKCKTRAKDHKTGDCVYCRAETHREMRGEVVRRNRRQREAM